MSRHGKTNGKPTSKSSLLPVKDLAHMSSQVGLRRTTGAAAELKQDRRIREIGLLPNGLLASKTFETDSQQKDSLLDTGIREW